MGANGAHASGVLEKESGRMYKTIFTFEDNIKVIEQKNPKQNGKLPEESKTPDRIYVAFFKDGKDIKEIAKYGKDGKKEWAIHTKDHHGVSPHYHKWKDGKPSHDAYPLTSEMKKLLKKIKDYADNK